LFGVEYSLCARKGGKQGKNKTLRQKGKGIYQDRYRLSKEERQKGNETSHKLKWLQKKLHSGHLSWAGQRGRKRRRWKGKKDRGDF